jgi:starch phosphorylase
VPCTSFPRIHVHVCTKLVCNRYILLVRALKRITVRNVLPTELAHLHDLATNLQWSWDSATRELFTAIDPGLWEIDPNPLSLLAATSPQRLAELAQDGGFVQRVNDQHQMLQRYLQRPSWFSEQISQPAESITGIAYFSPEFGVTAALPQYSGGLGILAGDHLKSASDLGVPIIGIGLFYRSGYFHQSLSRDGWQLEEYPVTSPQASPVTLLRDVNEEPSLVGISLPSGEKLFAQIWVATVGRVPLLLLDSDIESNDLTRRGVTDRLYGGSVEDRLTQELLLGVGGVRALRAYCRITQTPTPNVFHTNEGHAGFLGIERMRELIEGPDALTFAQALEATRANTVFTTHTPVPAGIDRFPAELIKRCFTGECASPGMPADLVLELGIEPDGDFFNMAMMGFRLAGRANGVSLLHGEVSREMFAHLWPGFDNSDIPITSITNGVHAPTWVSPRLVELAKDQLGITNLDEIWDHIDSIPESELWSAKRAMRVELIDMVRRRLKASWLQRGMTNSELDWVDRVLDPDVLTVGFARRVPSYKRLTLMLRNPERLRGLLTSPEQPIQLVIAGKAHPADEGGKVLIQELVRFADAHDVRDRIVFLPNYEIEMATTLYPGCDVWLNNPIRPLEASGTSGMKAALNAGLNLSIMDGWWDEWFDGSNGWAIPSANLINDPERRDDLEAEALYSLIESRVAPTFYRRGEDGIPHDWVAMMRHTMKHTGPMVLATRMVREYVERLYAPAAQSGALVCAHSFALAKEVADWKSWIIPRWSKIKIEHVEISGQDEVAHVGVDLHISVYVMLGEIGPQNINLSAVTGLTGDHDQILQPGLTSLVDPQDLGNGRWHYEGEIKLVESGSFGFSVRITPQHRGLISGSDLGLHVVPGEDLQGPLTDFPSR